MDYIVSLYRVSIKSIYNLYYELCNKFIGSIVFARNYIMTLPNLYVLFS